MQNINWATQTQCLEMARSFRSKLRLILAIAVSILLLNLLISIRLTFMYSARDAPLKTRGNIYELQERLQAHIGHSEREVALSPDKKVTRFAPACCVLCLIR